jgi:3-phenylpropionate/trans-cinnamate dioxygenase ferredoxin component
MTSQYVTFCKSNEIQLGEREIFDLDIGSIILFNVEGTFYAVENLCSHEEYELADGELKGCILECPKHGATFDIQSGQHLSTPAYTPITIYPVRVAGDEVQVQLEME